MTTPSSTSAVRNDATGSTVPEPALRSKDPHIPFDLEMITRDPLKIPVFTDKYWVTFDDAYSPLPGRDLARVLEIVRKNKPKNPPPKLGFRFLQATTTWGSICGRGFIACLRCGDPAMIGRMQSTMMPIPMLAPLGTKPACRQAALICAQG